MRFLFSFAYYINIVSNNNKIILIFYFIKPYEIINPKIKKEKWK